MKAYNLVFTPTEQTTMEICLGNKARLKFSSKREMGYFMAEANQFLTKQLVIANDMYATLFLHYRTLWIVCSNYKQGTKTFNTKIVSNIKSLLDSTDNCIDKVSYLYDQPIYSFIDLIKTFEFMADAATKLAEGFKQKNHTAHLHSCMVLYDRCLIAITQLKSFAYNNVNCTNELDC